MYSDSQRVMVVSNSSISYLRWDKGARVQAQALPEIHYLSQISPGKGIAGSTCDEITEIERKHAKPHLYVNVNQV